VTWREVTWRVVDVHVSRCDRRRAGGHAKERHHAGRGHRRRATAGRQREVGVRDAGPFSRVFRGISSDFRRSSSVPAAFQQRFRCFGGFGGSTAAENVQTAGAGAQGTQASKNDPPCSTRSSSSIGRHPGLRPMSMWSIYSSSWLSVLRFGGKFPDHARSLGNILWEQQTCAPPTQ
jgi:hypothetical protein